MTLYALFPLAGTILFTILLALLIWKRIFRTLPVFTLYLGLGICSGFIGWIAACCFPQLRVQLWNVNAALDVLTFFGLLAEVRGNVLRRNPSSSPFTILGAVLFLLCSWLVWSLAQWSVPPEASFARQLSVFLYQASSIVQVAGMLALLTWSGVLGLRWPEHEIKIVSGLAVNSLISLAVVILHTHTFIGWGSYWLDFLPPASYLCVLVYWLHYFWLAPGTPRQALDGDAASATNGEEKSTAPQEEMPWFAGAGPAPWRVSAPPREG